jgi:hypothetical protein
MLYLGILSNTIKLLSMKGLKLVGVMMILFLIGCQEDKCDEIVMRYDVEHIYIQRTDGSYQVNIKEIRQGAVGYCQCWELKNENDSLWEVDVAAANPTLRVVMENNPNECNCF